MHFQQQTTCKLTRAYNNGFFCLFFLFILKFHDLKEKVISATKFSHSNTKVFHLVFIDFYLNQVGKLVSVFLLNGKKINKSNATKVWNKLRANRDWSGEYYAKFPCGNLLLQWGNRGAVHMQKIIPT